MPLSHRRFVGRLCRHTRLPLLFVLAILLGSRASASADEADDPSGTLDEDLHVMFGKKEVWVSYSALFHDDRTCSCLVHARELAHGRFQFDDDAGFTGVLTRDNRGVNIKLTSPPTCCGAGWPYGFPDNAEPAQPPARCTVQRARSYFLAGTDSKTGAYVERGDIVDTLPASGHPKQVLARFKGKKKWTLGLLPKADLRCKSRTKRSAE